MGVFVDGWTLDVAGTVTGLHEDRVLDLLDSLVGHSLMTIEPSSAEPRYRMLETIRALSAERLAGRADRADVERLHAGFYRHLAETADQADASTGGWGHRLRPDEGNLSRSIRWHLQHDVGALPHLFRTPWFFWQLRDHLPQARGWIRELASRTDELDRRGRLELHVLEAVTAAQVGDDQAARDALTGIDEAGARMDDPSLASVARLAASWVLPIDGEMDGALAAAIEARDGFHARHEPFEGGATFTVGVLQLVAGRLEEAHDALVEADSPGARLGNSWLVRAARRRCRADRPGHHVRPGRARPSALALDDPERAARSLGAASGLRQRSGSTTWPLLRGDEAALAAAVSGALGPEAFERASRAGIGTTRRQAIALLQGLPPAA